MDAATGSELSLPRMNVIHQHFAVAPPVDVLAGVAHEWATIKGCLDLTPGMSIAVGVGSRGITDLETVVRTVVTTLKEAGCNPFITPAMGSHGGATVEGQIEVLAVRGITEESLIARALDVLFILDEPAPIEDYWFSVAAMREDWEAMPEDWIAGEVDHAVPAG